MPMPGMCAIPGIGIVVRTVLLHAATNVSIDFPTFLVYASPRQERQSMQMPLAACSHRLRHIYPYSSGLRVAQKSKDIYADAPWLPAATGFGIDFPTFLVYVSPRKKRKSTQMPLAACKHKHRHRFLTFLGDASPGIIRTSTWMPVDVGNHTRRH